MTSRLTRSGIAALLSLASLSSALAAGEPPDGITVTGSAELRLLPEEAALDVAVERRAESADRAMALAGEVAARFLDTVRQIEADDTDIGSTDIQVMPQYRWNEERREREQTGFLARRDIQLHIRDLAKLSEYLRAAASSGMTHVSPPVMGLSKPGVARREALATATRDARASAESIAAAAGRQLGPLLALDAEPRRSQPPRPVAMRAMASAESDDAGGGIAVGEIVIEAEVRARFSLKD